MAQNPRFNNKDMFTNIDSNDYSKITPDNKSEVLATQGNVINSIKTFWNNIRKKLAYAISRPNYNTQVGGNYVPIFVDADGVVRECQPTTIQANIAQNGIITIPTNDIPNDNIYTGTTVCISVLNNTGSNNDLQIQHKDSASPVKYPSGVTVQAKDISKGDLLLATFCKNSTSSSNNFWILLNKINTVVSKAVEGGGHPGLMTAEDKEKLDTIDEGANNYSLPKATDMTLGGVKSKDTGTREGRDYNVQVNSDGTMKVNVPWTDTTYTLSTASSSTLGGVKLGADKLPSLDTPSAGSTNSRYYPIQTDKDDKLVVNVPWQNTHNTATLRVGKNDTATNEATTNGNMYLKIVDGNNKSALKISGGGNTTVTSDNNGNITISSQDGFIPNNINATTNIDTNGKYTVKGAGDNADTNHYLAGNGTWQKGLLVPYPVETDKDKILKCNGLGSIYWADVE